MVRQFLVNSAVAESATLPRPHCGTGETTETFPCQMRSGRRSLFPGSFRCERSGVPPAKQTYCDRPGSSSTIPSAWPVTEPACNLDRAMKIGHKPLLSALSLLKKKVIRKNGGRRRFALPGSCTVTRPAPTVSRSTGTGETCETFTRGAPLAAGSACLRSGSLITYWSTLSLSLPLVSATASMAGGHYSSPPTARSSPAAS